MCYQLCITIHIGKETEETFKEPSKMVIIEEFSSKGVIFPYDIIG